MSQFGAILRAKGRMGVHALGAIKTESRLKIAVVSSAAFLLWLGALLAFIEGFAWLQRQGLEEAAATESLGLADILMVRLLSIFALALFFMLIFSNILISFSTMYKAREVQYLLHAPIPIRTLFLSRFLECVSFSSWASAYLGSPLMLAYGVTTNAHPLFYLAAIVFYIPFVMIPASTGCVITLVLVRIFPRLPRFVFFLMGACAVGILFLYLKDAFDAERLGEGSPVAYLLEATVRTQSPLMPSFWASQGVLAAAQGLFRQSLFHFLLLLSNALMALWIATETANLIFATGYSALFGGSRNDERPLGKGMLGRVDGMLFFLKNPLRSLVAKDIRLFWRDATQWTQFAIFFGIMAVYVANIGNRDMDFETATYRSWVASLNSGACALILASLTSRFVYPLISLEGFRFWILGLAPLTRKQLIWQKYWLSVATTSPFTIGLTVLSCIFLDVGRVHFFFAVYTIILANFALAGLAVGLGSIYPNFEEDNPARIVSGMGGTLNFLLSVGYITLVIGSQMAILSWYAIQESQASQPLVLAFGGVLLFNTLLSLAAARIPMYLGLRNLIRTEF